MSHAIEAIITTENPNPIKLKELDLSLFEETGFHIIPLNNCHAIFWGKKWGVYDDYGEHFGGVNPVSMNTINKIVEELEISNYALIATDYFGGFGHQAARVYQNGKEVQVKGKQYDNGWGLKGVDINSALREIGVVKKEGMDEFDTLNLSNYRHFEDYFEKYEDACEEE